MLGEWFNKCERFLFAGLVVGLGCCGFWRCGVAGVVGDAGGLVALRALSLLWGCCGVWGHGDRRCGLGGVAGVVRGCLLFVGGFVVGVCVGLLLISGAGVPLWSSRGG